jgi:curli biogenesis system outer membrane secretion channel CsgG
MRLRVLTGLVATLALAGMMVSPASAESDRPIVAVMDFDYSAVNNWWSGVWGNYDVGKGVADMVVDELINDGNFRVVERKRIDTVLAEQDFAQSDRADPSAAKMAQIGKVLGVRYIIAGSITKFNTSDKKYGAGGIVKGPIGGLGFKKSKSEVQLNARVIDATTGEILVAAKGKGESSKGGGVTVAGGAGGVGGGFSMGSDEYRASALGEAQEEACVDLVENIVKRKNRLEQ